MKLNVKKVLKEIAIGAVLLYIFSNIISYIRKPTLESKHLPSFEVTLLDGSKYIPTKGKPLVIHFWATWCPTCKLEADNIERISKKYEVLTVAVNSGKNEKLEAYIKEKGLTFRVLNDTEGNLAKQFRVEAFPTTFIYDAKGTLHFTEVGYTSTAGFLARLGVL